MSKNTPSVSPQRPDVAIFADAGPNLLVALRELIGDLTPKYGCGQGSCGTCRVPIDGELHLACLTLAETVAGRASRRRRPQGGRNLHPLQRAFMLSISQLSAATARRAC